MKDLETALKNLPGHTLALCKNGAVLTSNKRGVAPMLNYLKNGQNLKGYSAADRVVGKAAAMLFIKAGVAALYAEVLSQSGLALLKKHGVAVQYGTLTPAIKNRAGTGLCPMEQAVLTEQDIETGVALIAQKFNQLQSAAK